MRKDDANYILEPYIEMILKKRYYLPNENWSALCSRVSGALFGEEGMGKQKREAYQMYFDRKAIMASPTLMNADARLRMLSSCFIYPIHDSLKSIFGTLELTAETFKMAGGVGIDFSTLRPAGAIINTTGGVSTGPVSFMMNYDVAGTSVSGGGLRKAAQIGVLRAEHPDVPIFIEAKSEAQRQGDGKYLSNMNLSVAIPDSFFAAFEAEDKQPEDWFTCIDDEGNINPNEWKRIERHKRGELGCGDVVSDELAKALREQHGEMYVRQAKEGLWQLHWGGEISKVISSKVLFRRIAEEAWEAGCPGLIFIDEVNKYNYTPNVGYIRNPNPCFSGDTKIAVADSRGFVTIADLAKDGEDCQIYSVGLDGTLKVTVGVKPRLTRKNASTVNVYIENAGVLQVTPDHIFMLQNGLEKRADELQPNDSLHHLTVKEASLGEMYFRYGEERSKRKHTARYVFADLNGDGFIAEHRLVARDLIGGNIENNLVHHKDYDSRNNLIDNLDLMTPKEHRAYHAEEMKGKKNPYHRCFNSEQRLQFAVHNGSENGRFRECKESDLRDHVMFLLKKHGTITGGSWNKWINKRGIKDKIPFCQSHKEGRTQGKSLDELVECLTTEDERCRHRFERRVCIQCGQEFNVERNSCVQLCSEACSIVRKNKQSREAKKRYCDRKLDQIVNYRVLRVEEGEPCDVFNLTSRDYFNYFVVVEGDKDNYGAVAVRNCGEFYSILPGVDEYNPHPSGLPRFENGGPTCNLGSINIDAHMVRLDSGWKFEINWKELEKNTRLMIRALDRVVDVNSLPTEESAIITQIVRPLGLGVFGVANMLIRMGLRYDSEEGRQAVGELLERMTYWSMDESVDLAVEAREKDKKLIGYFDPEKLKSFAAKQPKEKAWTWENVFSPWNDDDHLRGSFPSIRGSMWDIGGVDLGNGDGSTPSRQRIAANLRGAGCHFGADMIEHGHLSMTFWIDLFKRIQKDGIRHCHTTFLMPTGTTSYICNCTESSGIEPIYQLSKFKRKHAETTETGKTVYVEHWYYPQVVLDYAETVFGLDRQKIIQGEQEVSLDSLPDFFVSSFDISPENHVLMQATCQRFIHNGISKTINLPESATVEDVMSAYKQARETGCRGVTVYRHHSKSEQIYDFSVTGEEQRRILPKAPLKVSLARMEDSKMVRIPDQEVSGNKDVYVSFTLLDGKWPIEFLCNFDASAYTESTTLLQYRSLAARLSSNLLRRGVPAEEVIRNWRACSSSPGDFTAQVATALTELLSGAHCDDSNEVLSERTLNIIRPVCDSPGCSGRMIVEGGCWKCIECGISKCG